MKIKGIHYGLTLLYSYLLPFFEIRETHLGFEFVKRHGALPGIKCHFHENDLLTQCEIPSNIGASNKIMHNILGLSKRRLYEQLCTMVDSYKDGCLINQITLMFNPLDAKDILRVIVLSHNTDYYLNAIRWANLIFSGYSLPENLPSYIPKILARLEGKLSQLSFNSPSRDLIRGLLSTKNIGPKTVTALLLHGYGMTQYAPVDRHFEKRLSTLANLRQPLKKYCVEYSLQCEKCLIGIKCKYGVSARLFGRFNGVLQSVSYIVDRLKIRRSPLENILVKNVRDYEYLDKLLSTLIANFNVEKGVRESGT